MALNYSLYEYENKAVENLAEGIKPTKKSILNQKNREVSPMLMLPGKKITSQIQSHMLRNEDSEKSVVKMFEKIREFSFDLQKNTTRAAGNSFAYLVSLTKPIDQAKQEDTLKVLEDEKTLLNAKDNEVGESSQVKDRVVRISKPTSAESLSKPKETPNLPEEHKEETLEEATLNIVSNADKESSEEMGLFEKLENRILKKLQNTGMSDYDIWLELGDLYVKYNEVKKAMEIYALVLKHSNDEAQKEKAMNKLIGL